MRLRQIIESYLYLSVEDMETDEQKEGRRGLLKNEQQMRLVNNKSANMFQNNYRLSLEGGEEGSRALLEN